MAAMSHAPGPLLKTTIFTVLVPGTAAVYVPWYLRGQAALAASGVEKWLACCVVAVGVAIYLYTAFWGFAMIGGGTPAPIAPTQRLVVVGLHRFVRNPMYIGVVLTIGGQAWLFHSTPVAIYMVCLGLAFHTFVLLYEEPTLRRRFGDEYERYCASVRRWIPRWPR